MNKPTPAIVSQDAARRLPRWALLLFCLAYAVPGLVGRAPWKSADLASFGYMLEMARGQTSWMDPRLLGLRPEADGLLPYWLGAAAIRLGDGWLAPAMAARLPFFVLLGLAMAATWYAVYLLARKPQAQPVAFAFGGEARPSDYARAIADGGLLALIACLGLAQLAHEITTSVAQLAFTALAFYGAAGIGRRRWWPEIGLLLGLAGLALSGAPTISAFLGAGAAVLHVLATARPWRKGDWRVLGIIALATLLAILLSSSMDLWRWRILLPQDAGSKDWRTILRLLVWFTWPAWPLVMWSLWRWRLQVWSRTPSLHVALPLWFMLVTLVAALTTKPADRALLLALPAMATVAAFALPTLTRSVAALIDWFTLLFFTGCGAIIWIIWIAMQTGYPRQGASNVQRQAPDFVASFSLPVFLVALVATLVWGWLVHWRVGRHRAAIWKSMVLPAGGAALCWLLLMSLWMPLLDYVRSYSVVVRNVMAIAHPAQCIQQWGLSREQVAAFAYHGGYRISQATPDQLECPWLVVNPEALAGLQVQASAGQWQLLATLRRPSDKGDDVMLLRRTSP